MIGEVVGDYHIVAFLGAGGMGEVYRAVHTASGQPAAVKILTAASRHPNFTARFLNEARIQAGLRHPNIVAFYHSLEFRGRPCIIMECVDGPTLIERIRARGALPWREALPIFRAVVEAITHIHAHGVVHRDIKANNIKINSRGQVKLLDFGLARSELTPRLTAAGKVVGTLEYLSPEQIKGEVADARSDIWALGVLLYEMLTGRVPFRAPATVELYKQIVNGGYAAPSELSPEVPRRLDEVIQRCLEKEPAGRYQSAQELLRDTRWLALAASLRRALAGLPQTLERSGQSLHLWAQRNWRMLLIVVAAVCIIAVGVYIATKPIPQAAPARSPRPARSVTNQHWTPSAWGDGAGPVARDIKQYV
jgi:serine/threonine protein kinase